MGFRTDSDPDFTDEFCRFLQQCVANVDAAELLLALFNEPQRTWRSAELRAQLASSASLSEADVERYLAAFESNSLVTRDSAMRVQYRSQASQDGHVALLARLYMERPVTLFRMIYALRDSAITTFADAFKLRR